MNEMVRYNFFFELLKYKIFKIKIKIQASGVDFKSIKAYLRSVKFRKQVELPM